MSEVDWSKAPEWADRVMGIKSYKYWCNVSRYAEFNFYSCSGEYSIFMIGETTIGDMELIEMRTDEWKKGEERMDQVGQNGNGGEHYAELDDFDKQPRYKGDDGLDWIDEFARDNSISDFRAAMRFTIGKYEKRLGKKDAMSKELYKMSDYYKRWSEVEKKIELDGLAKIKEFMEQEK